ncbi:hypothetical protein AOC21_09980 [Polynucleobacter sp. VK25]|uniref:hypothetical protein n=1 Tax=Polynucleobacter sp. VK25 TaxID=1758398 RepID=UPI001BFD6EAB|nr:hypothetical protein [Polynucleobacter sp. VK25]QWD68335.1 hypothetical protein AOC21_09980 [Polynucleobacter sp. VK25]
MNLKKLAVLPLLLFATFCCADEYAGLAEYDGGKEVGLIYTFDASDKANLKGSVQFIKTKSVPCLHLRSIDGSYIEGDKIYLTSTVSPELQSIGCGPFNLIGKIDDNKIVGSFHLHGEKYPVTLTRQ